jgi:hypothetical protein
VLSFYRQVTVSVERHGAMTSWGFGLWPTFHFPIGDCLRVAERINSPRLHGPVARPTLELKLLQNYRSKYIGAITLVDSSVHTEFKNGRGPGI